MNPIDLLYINNFSTLVITSFYHCLTEDSSINSHSYSIDYISCSIESLESTFFKTTSLLEEIENWLSFVDFRSQMNYHLHPSSNLITSYSTLI